MYGLFGIITKRTLIIIIISIIFLISLFVALKYVGPNTSTIDLQSISYDIDQLKTVRFNIDSSNEIVTSSKAYSNLTNYYVYDYENTFNIKEEWIKDAVIKYNKNNDGLYMAILPVSGHEEDIKKGSAPNIENVTEFYGTCDMVTIDMEKMKIVNPKYMFDENVEVDEYGNRPFSSTYKSIISFLESQIEIESQDKNNINTLTVLKRRLHSLTANFVEYLVGGVSAADRDNVKDLVEDAILNCRSAAENGVGYGAGLEGLIASTATTPDDPIEYEMSDIISDAYEQIMKNLYMSVMNESDAESTIEESLAVHKVYNIREKSFHANQVYTSIETDTVILEAISRIITIMYTANQALLVDPMQNAYINLDED